MQLSARNKLFGKIKKLTTGVVNTEVVIALPSGEELVSVITKTSATTLSLKKGSSVVAVIKSSDIYVGGAFKAFSLMRALRLIGMETAIVGSQTGDKEDYRQLQEMAEPGTIIVDDSNPLELAKFCLEKDVDLFIGGVKERPIAYKLGIGFCDHNHERKEPLAGYVGMLNFAKEVYASVASPVWRFAPRRANRPKRGD